MPESHTRLVAKESLFTQTYWGDDTPGQLRIPLGTLAEEESSDEDSQRDKQPKAATKSRFVRSVQCSQPRHRSQTRARTVSAMQARTASESPPRPPHADPHPRKSDSVSSMELAGKKKMWGMFGGKTRPKPAKRPPASQAGPHPRFGMQALRKLPSAASPFASRFFGGSPVAARCSLRRVARDLKIEALLAQFEHGVSCQAVVAFSPLLVGMFDTELRVDPHSAAVSLLFAPSWTRMPLDLNPASCPRNDRQALRFIEDIRQTRKRTLSKNLDALQAHAAFASARVDPDLMQPVFDNADPRMRAFLLDDMDTEETQNFVVLDVLHILHPVLLLFGSRPATEQCLKVLALVQTFQDLLSASTNQKVIR